MSENFEKMYRSHWTLFESLGRNKLIGKVFQLYLIPSRYRQSMYFVLKPDLHLCVEWCNYLEWGEVRYCLYFANTIVYHRRFFGFHYNVNFWYDVSSEFLLIFLSSLSVNVLSIYVCLPCYYVDYLPAVQFLKRDHRKLTWLWPACLCMANLVISCN